MLSPTLFTIFTNDTPLPTRGHNITYADDVTQIIGYAGRSKEISRRQTATAIDRQNSYEKKWNISTNTSKFTVIKLGGRLIEQIITNTDIHETKNTGHILGLHITKTCILDT